jgi:hypothetical protein
VQKGAVTAKEAKIFLYITEMRMSLAAELFLKWRPEIPLLSRPPEAADTQNGVIRRDYVIINIMNENKNKGVRK